MQNFLQRATRVRVEPVKRWDKARRGMPETERDNRLTATASRPAAVADAAGLALCQGRGDPPARHGPSFAATLSPSARD